MDNASWNSAPSDNTRPLSPLIQDQDMSDARQLADDNGLRAASIDGQARQHQMQPLIQPHIQPHMQPHVQPHLQPHLQPSHLQPHMQHFYSPMSQPDQTNKHFSVQLTAKQDVRPEYTNIYHRNSVTPIALPPPVDKEPTSQRKQNDSDADSTDDVDLLRYSVGEQNAILSKKVKTLKEKRAKDKEKIAKLKDKHQRVLSDLDKNRFDISNEDVDRLKQQFEKERQRLHNRINESDLEVRDLNKEIKRLKEEASSYQSALGIATNVRWSDEDSNNSVQLTQAISDLQHTLNDFAKAKGSGVKLNEAACDELLEKYKCRTRMSDKRPKLVVGAAFQRLVLEIIFNSIEEYGLGDKDGWGPAEGESTDEGSKDESTDERSKDDHMAITLPTDNNALETNLLTTTRHLIRLVQEFSSTRNGEDHQTAIAPTKLRQQIYAVLGCRAFVKPDHPFVVSLTDQVVETLSHYRTIPDDAQKQAELRNDATALVYKAVHMYFRLYTQEPIPQFRNFFEAGEKIAVSTMSGPWDEEHIEELEVEICSFPMVGHHDNKRVLTKALVIPRK
ncbi:8036_t:CDS:2 [Paraglomus brasilianum]|uniref:8036_t:CDS:1 n=1 Tax=Paraglomus brasilianum TaxID=144538 RepID=A0A9N8W8U6_9GLOM|nr:8036_t:CDS:2 [Paraglomus brasilianum]